MSSSCVTSVFALMVLCFAAAGRWYYVNHAFSVTGCAYLELLIRNTFFMLKKVGQLKFMFMSRFSIKLL